jgi:dTDP-4-amino-4,6-dideoxygalactose transaminase
MSQEIFPFIDISRTINLIKEDVKEDWWHLSLRNGNFFDDSIISNLEKKLSDYINIKEVITCANGTDAIEILLIALGIGKGKKVALPNVTFWATYEAVVNVGATPILVDIDQKDLQLSLTQLKIACDKYDIDAVIIAHLFGWASAELNEIRRYAEKENILLIEDSAQCFGVKYRDGNSILASTKYSTLSFYPTKVLGGCMDGGAIVTNDLHLATLCRKIRNHGREDHYSFSIVGRNSRLSTINAIYLNRVLDIFDQILQSRREALSYINSAITNDKVQIIHEPKNIIGNGYLSVLLCQKEHLYNLENSFKKAAIAYRRTYSQTIDMQPPARVVDKVGKLNMSREFVESVFNPPLFAFMREDELERIVKAINES